MPAQLILASSSARRRELLERIGFAVKVMPANVDEKRVEGETPENYVKRLARAKVLAVMDRLQALMYPDIDPSGKRSGQKGEGPRWLLAADTLVLVGDEIMGKPRDNSDAADMLARLSGVEHVVMTGFCLFDMKKNKEGLQAISTTVKFKRLSRAEIDKYLTLGESLDKAGAYAVQGITSYMVERIAGSYTNVVGLPLCHVVEMMEEMGATDILPYQV